jgi:hypothetical protein
MLLFALATTLVYMGGLAALQHSCSSIPSVSNAAGSGIFGRAAFGESVVYLRCCMLSTLPSSAAILSGNCCTVGHA